MTVIEVIGQSPEFSNRQRWSHYFALLFAAFAFIIGINLRDSALYATVRYSNTAVGISASYPQSWLIDTDGDYVFRVRNITDLGFSTTIQVAVRPVSASTTPRSIFDSLTLNRSQTLAGYNPLVSGLTFILPDETVASLMNYTFAAADSDPFLESIPAVVRGQDLLAIKRGQAIIITFLSDSRQYDENYRIFEQFLNSLEF